VWIFRQCLREVPPANALVPRCCRPLDGNTGGTGHDGGTTTAPGCVDGGSSMGSASSSGAGEEANIRRIVAAADAQVAMLRLQLQQLVTALRPPQPPEHPPPLRQSPDAAGLKGSARPLALAAARPGIADKACLLAADATASPKGTRAVGSPADAHGNRSSQAGGELARLADCPALPSPDDDTPHHTQPPLALACMLSAPTPAELAAIPMPALPPLDEAPEAGQAGGDDAAGPLLARLQRVWEALRMPCSEALAMLLRCVRMCMRLSGLGGGVCTGVCTNGGWSVGRRERGGRCMPLVHILAVSCASIDMWRVCAAVCTNCAPWLSGV
jgi:hypothetical protein